jgi:release factor glutamine methyltransferase
MKSSRKTVFYADFSFEVFEEVYEPAEDTFLIADKLGQAILEGDAVLDIGTGCGILAVTASKKASKVVATDANPHAVECAKRNAKANKASSKVEVRFGDLFEPILKTEKFDVILFNAPYLPSTSKEQKAWISRAWAGGRNGRQIIDDFITNAPNYLKENGRILIVQSTLSNVQRTLMRFRDIGVDAKILAEKKVAFETIVVIQASHLSKQSI